MTDHVITVESTQIHRGQVSLEMAEFLTSDGIRENIYGREFTGHGPPLEFSREEKRTYECSCGERFRKGATARAHLEQYRDADGGGEP